LRRKRFNFAAKRAESSQRRYLRSLSHQTVFSLTPLASAR
jgi:hypothetical protein